MANSLIRSNRNQSHDTIKPAKVAKASDFDTDEQGNTSNVTSITFDTNLKISNHARNKLQAMAMIGYSENQRLALDVAIQAFTEQLSSNEMKEFNLQVETLESRDVRLKSKK